LKTNTVPVPIDWMRTGPGGSLSRVSIMDKSRYASPGMRLGRAATGT
jgi:hypothetical protein